MFEDKTSPHCTEDKICRSFYFSRLSWFRESVQDNSATYRKFHLEFLLVDFWPDKIKVKGSESILSQQAFRTKLSEKSLRFATNPWADQTQKVINEKSRFSITRNFFESRTRDNNKKVSLQIIIWIALRRN